MTQPVEAPPFAAMGVLAPMLADGRYLALLNLNEPAPSIEALGAIVRSDAPSLEADVVAALDPALFGWRPQLVGAVAMLLGATTPATLAALWRALDQPSWVFPQLAVTAFLRASDFEARARARIEALCRDDGKSLGAMIALCKADGAPDWLAPLEASQAVRDVLATSRDDGAGLALRWLGRVRNHVDRLV